jgi:hypothetical protein
VPQKALIFGFCLNHWKKRSICQRRRPGLSGHEERPRPGFDMVLDEAYQPFLITRVGQQMLPYSVGAGVPQTVYAILGVEITSMGKGDKALKLTAIYTQFK